MFNWRKLVTGGWDLILAGILSGLAFALYTVALNLTDVVRVILLFYMTPLWSTLLGILLLGEKLTINRTVGLLLAFTGLLVVLGAGYRIPVPANTGDWFALISGLLRSFASVRLFTGGAVMLTEKVFLFVFFAFIGCAALVFLPLGHDASVPDFANLAGGWIWVLVIVLLMLPMTYLTIWPTTL